MSSQFLYWLQIISLPPWPYMLICVVFISSLHQAWDHRAIYIAGFLLFTGREAPVEERSGLDTGSPSQLTASLKSSTWFIQPVVSLLINTLQFPSQNYLWNFLGTMSSKITQQYLCWLLIGICVITLSTFVWSIFPGNCFVVVVDLTHHKSNTGNSNCQDLFLLFQEFNLTLS